MLGKSDDDGWRLGQNFFHGYASKFDLETTILAPYTKISIGVNQCHFGIFDD